MHAVNLHRQFSMDKYRLPLLQTKAVIFKITVALAVNCFIFVSQVYRRRSYSPEPAVFFIPYIDILVRNIDNGIILEISKLFQAAVGMPGIASAVFTNYCTQIPCRNYVAPRQKRASSPAD